MLIPRMQTVVQNIPFSYRGNQPYNLFWLLFLKSALFAENIAQQNTLLVKYKAFLFDLNGTMIDDMQYHIRAWHHILNELGADISMERMKQECYGKNQELLERIFPSRFTEEEKNKMSWEKERQYQEEFRPYLHLLKGLDVVLQKAEKAGIKMAIGSAAIRFNIDFVLDNLGIRHYFSAIVSADHVRAVRSVWCEPYVADSSPVPGRSSVK